MAKEKGKKKKKAKGTVTEGTPESALLAHALFFLASQKNGVKTDEFPEALHKYLIANDKLVAGDRTKSEEIGGTRGEEEVVKQRIRNLISHRRLDAGDVVLEKNGVYTLNPKIFVPSSAGASSVGSMVIAKQRKKGEKPRLLAGPPGTGKTLLANSYIRNNKYYRVQFHPSYTYEYFVQGERIITLAGERHTQIIDGPFMMVYRKATNSPARSKCSVKRVGTGLGVAFPTGLLAQYEIKSPTNLLVKFPWAETFVVPSGLLGEWFQFEFPTDKNRDDFIPVDKQAVLEVQFKAPEWEAHDAYFLLIDEINRADTSKVFGELLNAIAEIDSSNPVPVRLQYSGEEIVWPDNLTVIATMNSADRSIGEIDQAMRRRFQYVEVPPRHELLAGKFNDTDEDRDFAFLTDLQATLNANDYMIKDLEKGGFIKSAKDLLDKKLTCDSLIELINAAIKAKDKKTGATTPPLPLLSVMMENLNAIICANGQIFDAKMKCVGHSFFIDIAKQLAKEIANSVARADFDQSKIKDADFTGFYNIIDKAIQTAIRPQLFAICSEDERMVNEIEQKWFNGGTRPAEKKAA